MSYGSTQYDRKSEQALAPRDVEAAAFSFVNKLLDDASNSHERTMALGRNHRLWTLLLTDIGLTSNGLPPILKKDLVSIGSWSMSYSIIAMGRDLSLRPLIDINSDMIAALRIKATTPDDGNIAPAPFDRSRMNLAAAV
jgi:flagellar protein FlaF